MLNAFSVGTGGAGGDCVYRCLQRKPELPEVVSVPVRALAKIQAA